MMLGRMLRRKTDPKSGKQTLCEPAQSKCTWACHKRHFGQKFTGKMPDATGTTSIEHPPLTLTVRTPTVWPHVATLFGEQETLLDPLLVSFSVHFPAPKWESFQNPFKAFSIRVTSADMGVCVLLQWRKTAKGRRKVRERSAYHYL